MKKFILFVGVVAFLAWCFATWLSALVYTGAFIMSDSIRLHPEHGVNPTMGVCFFCQKPDGTIALLGWNGGKKEPAPQYSITSKEPCNTCKDKMSKGIALIEANEHGEGLQVGVRTWLTGRWLVVAPSWCERAFSEEMLAKVLEHRKAYIDVEAFTKLAEAAKLLEP